MIKSNDALLVAMSRTARAHAVSSFDLKQNPDKKKKKKKKGGDGGGKNTGDSLKNAFAALLQ